MFWVLIDFKKVLNFIVWDFNDCFLIYKRDKYIMILVF